jgi:hypothetical protein
VNDCDFRSPWKTTYYLSKNETIDGVVLLRRENRDVNVLAGTSFLIPKTGNHCTPISPVSNV